MFRKYSILLLVCVSASVLTAQESTTTSSTSAPRTNPEDQLLYKNEASGGLIFHSSGWGLEYRRGRHITGFKKGVFELNVATLKHPKEIKTHHPDFQNAKSYVYGKENAIILLRPGFGLQKVLFGRSPDRKGIEIRYMAFAGVSLAYAKPVYLEILRPTSDPLRPDLSTERYDPNNPYHTPDYIYGRAPYFKGFWDGKFYPGGYLKFALSFEYADLDDDVKAIETGITLDIYPKVVPIMAYATNQQVFFNFYIDFILGKKWF